MANEEMAPYLGVFLDEADEQLELLERDILALEDGATPELLQEIFRAAHTLKGSSRTMGFNAMGELTHAMEDVFDRLRNNTLTVHPSMVEALFQSLDMLKTLKEEIAATGNATTDTTELTARLRAVLNSADPSSPASGEEEPKPAGRVDLKHAEMTEAAQLAAQEARKDGHEIYTLTVSLAQDCLMKSVRALMVLQSLETVGSILSTTPDEEAIENEQFELTFGVIMASKRSAEEIRHLVHATSEVADVLVEPFKTEGAAETGPAEVWEAAMPEPRQEEIAAPVSEDERRIDLGPQARGLSPAELASAAAKKAEGQSQRSQTVRVDVARLDNLLNLVGELVIDQTCIAQVAGQIEGKLVGDPLLESLAEAAAHLGRITSEMQEEIMKARMLPIENVFNRFPRMMRDLALKLGKEVEFVVSGRETELDRSVIEAIGDPLIHILRNSLDHGVEMPEERLAAGKSRRGTVWLRARHEENHIIIEIEDDGRGIDPQKLRAMAIKKGILSQEAAARLTDREAIHLIFTSGFTTATTVSDISGRGVGMDIVKSNLTRLGALIDIDSKVGVGSKFTIKLPLTLAIIRGLLVRVASGVYALPLASVVETLRVPDRDIHIVNHQEVILQRGATLPLLRLQQVFYGAQEQAARGSASDSKDPASHYVVVIGMAERRVGLVVDALVGEQEIVIKSLGKFIGDIPGISGATLLGDGRIALIVDANGLLSVIKKEKGGAYAARGQNHTPRSGRLSTDPGEETGRSSAAPRDRDEDHEDD